MPQTRDFRVLMTCSAKKLNIFKFWTIELTSLALLNLIHSITLLFIISEHHFLQWHSFIKTVLHTTTLTLTLTHLNKYVIISKESTILVVVDQEQHITCLRPSTSMVVTQLHLHNNSKVYHQPHFFFSVDIRIIPHPSHISVSNDDESISSAERTHSFVPIFNTTFSCQ